MKMKRYATSTAILTAGTAAGLFATAATLSAAPNYTFTAIPDTLGGSSSYANGINDSGTVVGKADNAVGNFHAFSDSNGVMSDLNNLTTNLPVGFVLTNATGINSLGDIAGVGTNSAGQQEAFILTPVPEPGALLCFNRNVTPLFQ